MRKLSGSVRFALGQAAMLVAAGVTPNAGWAASWTEIDSGLPGVGVGINSMVIDPANSSTIYAQTVGNSVGNAVVPSLFKTTNGGGSWKVVGGVSGVASLAIDPTNSATIFAGTDHGVEKSTDAGATWSDASGGLPPGSIVRLVIDPTSPSTLYAVTTNVQLSPPGGPISMSICKTTDGGSNWSALNTGLPSSADITLLVIDPSVPSTLYTFAPVFDPTGTGASLVGGLLKTMDGGQTWQSLNSGLPPNSFVSSLAVDPNASATLYVPSNVGLLKSVDGGQTWNALKGLPPNTSVSFVVIDRATQSSIYAASTTFAPPGTTSSILKSSDGGQTWTVFNVGLTSNTVINTIAIDPESPAGIYAGTSVSFGILVNGSVTVPSGGGVGGMVKSTDGGETWNAASNGLVGFDVRTLAISATSGGAILAGGYGGASMSTDGGATWNSTGLSAYTGTLAADSATPATFYALTGPVNGCDSSQGLLLSSVDGGANWSNIVSPLNSGCILNAVFPSVHSTPIAIDSADSNTLYLGESDDQDGYSAVLKSTDKGASWSVAWDWFNGLRGGVLALAVEPSSSVIFAGIDDGQSGGLFSSMDGGATWIHTGLTTSAVNLIAVDPSNSQVVYAAAEGHYTQPSGFQGLFKSVDGGKTWLAVNNGLGSLMGSRSNTATALIVDPANTQVLYLGTSSGGVFQSSDGGGHWGAFNDGLASLQIRVLAVASLPSHAVYAATSAGVFKTVE